MTLDQKVMNELEFTVELLRGNDIGDVCDSLWANAFGTALVGKPEPSCTVSALTGDHRLSQGEGK